MLGNEVSAVAQLAGALDGVNNVLAFDAPANKHPLAAVLAPQLAAVAGNFTHVLAPSTTFGKDLLPRLAALCDRPAISDVMAVEIDGIGVLRHPVVAARSCRSPRRRERGARGGAAACPARGATPQALRPPSSVRSRT